MKKNIIVTILIILMLPCAQSQEVGHWRFWTQADGLGLTFCGTVTMGRNGNVLVTHGNAETISRLDGYEIEILPGSTSFTRIHESPAGELWFYNRNQGLNRLEQETWKNYTLPTSPLLQKMSVFAGLFRNFMVPLGGDRIVFLYPERLTDWDVISQESHTIVSASDTSIGYFSDLLKARNGEYWIAGARGLIHIPKIEMNRPAEQTWDEFPFPDAFPYQEFGMIVEGNSGEIFGTAFERKKIEAKTSDLIHWDGEKWNILLKGGEIDIDGFVSGVRDGNGTVWLFNVIGGGELLGFLENEKVNLLERMGRLSAVIYAFAVDEQGALWLATHLGLVRHALPTWQPVVAFQPFPFHVHAIQEDRTGCLWFLHREGFFYLQQGKWKHYPFPNEEFVFYRGQANVLCCLHDGRIALPVGPRFNIRSIALFDAEQGFIGIASHPQHRYILVSAPSRDEQMWVLTYSEKTEKLYLEKFDGNTFTTVYELDFPKPDTGLDMRDLHEARNGDIWLGSPQKKFSGFIRNGRFFPLSEEQGVSDNLQVLSILELEDGRIWLGSSDGIYEYKEERCTQIKKLFETVRSMIQAHDGSVYVTAGLSLYHYKDGSWVENTTEDGLTDAGIWEVFEDSQNRIWVGTSKGADLYHPEADADAPETYIDPQKNSKYIAPGGSAQFVFSGMDKWKYTKQERLLYSYRIDEETWTPFANETIASINKPLAPGSHRFQVRAMDRNWNIDQSPAEFEFFVLRPWYKEPVLISILTVFTFLILLFLGYAVNRHLRLRDSNQQLHFTNERLNQSNAELQHANARLLELDKMKSQFVSQASHDLRTPLTAIKGSLDNLLLGIAGDLNEKQQKVMTRATKSVDRLTNLINDVLDLNRIETGRIVLEKSDVPFKALLENIINENQPAVDQKQINLSLHAKPGDFTLHIDGGKISRVVGELIGNAIKYTPKNGTVEVTLTQTDVQIILSVKDSGIGMTKQECEKIWERFYRTNASKTFAKGSGLGLSIAKELVELHGGTLTVESEAGKGARFCMQLPCVC